MLYSLTMTQSGAKKHNRLAAEKSPYLLQHAANPVDWYPWSPAAFDKARREDKPVFLSVGYSTCHWCHVMERESFESDEIAALLNQDFVSIKVDREERPDIDHIYMTAVQAMTGSGGWPLTAFLTPDGKPFAGGTYFPPEDRYGRAGMKTILPRISQLWREKRQEMENAGQELAGVLTPVKQPPGAMGVNADLLDKAVQQFETHFDPMHGGFGGAPKFPRSHELSFLLRGWKRTGNDAALNMAVKTLEAMAAGGMYDHLGGGFHRYSTDEKWLIPHFEKMLYDQALLAKTYLEASRAAGRRDFAAVARDIFKYVLRDMTDPGGGFYSAEDADSEGEEGKFYVWRPEEVVEVLGAETGKIFNEIYGVTDEGNFEHAASALFLSQPPAERARLKKMEPGVLEALLLTAREKLFLQRKKRIPPSKDDKVLTAWNGLMITALAEGAVTLQDPALAQAAARAAGFILEHLQDKNGRLLRRWREGEAAILAFHDDYAFFSRGLLDLYEATLDARWLEESVRLAREMIRLFWDEESGGFFYAASGAENLIVRPKEYYDGAVPAGNSAAAGLLVRLARMTGDEVFEDKARRTMMSHAESLIQYPSGYPEMLMALDFSLAAPREIILAGDKRAPAFESMLAVVRSGFDPWFVLLCNPPGEEGARTQRLAPFLAKQTAPAGEVRGYVCENHVCKLPVSDAAGLADILKKSR